MAKTWNRLLGWTIVAVVLADWCSKFWIQNRIGYYETVWIVDGWLYFIHLQNKGIAFSLLGEGTPFWRLPLLIGAACVALFAIFRLARSISDARARFGLALVAGGALGNLGDRIANGGVTDFIAVQFFPYVFNIADIAVATGAVILVLALGTEKQAVSGV